MHPLIAKFNRAAARLNVRVTVTETKDPDRGVFLFVVDRYNALALVRAARNANHSAHAVEGDQIVRAVDVREETNTLDEVEFQRLIQRIDRLAEAADRAKRISQGRFTGPMSGAEAARYIRGRYLRP